ncbi:MAG: M23 family metallopeptidase, partial [Elusimicrobiota bacterium]
TALSGRRLACSVGLILGLLPIQAGDVSLLPRQGGGVPAAAAVPAVSPSGGGGTGTAPRLVSAPLSALYIRFDGVKTFMSGAMALNPTGGLVRERDDWGRGDYKAPRISKSHKRYHHGGIDYVGKVGQSVSAPVSGELKRVGAGADRGAVITGVINGRAHRIRMLHMDVHVRDGYVTQGQFIGRVMDLGSYYPGMTPHVHLAVQEHRGGSLWKEKDPLTVVRPKL